MSEYIHESHNVSVIMYHFVSTVGKHGNETVINNYTSLLAAGRIHWGRLMDSIKEKIKISELEKIIEYCFKNKSLLKSAITHSSYSNDNPNEQIQNYERLEFLGDTVFNCIITDFMYHNEQQLSEGDMTKNRAMIICEQSLYTIAQKYKIIGYIRIGNCLKAEQGVNASISADVIEALIGAIFLDSNYETARNTVLKLFKDILNNPIKLQGLTDYKSNLQEYFQKKCLQIPRYETVNITGPVHDRTYYTNVIINDEILGEGNAKSKKEAEQISAKNALLKLGILN